MNPNTPVIIGVGQILQRAEDIESAKEPIGLMLEAPGWRRMMLG